MLLEFSICLVPPAEPLWLPGFSGNVPVLNSLCSRWKIPWKKAGKPVLEQEKNSHPPWASCELWKTCFCDCCTYFMCSWWCLGAGCKWGPLCALGPNIVWRAKYWRIKAVGGWTDWRTLPQILAHFVNHNLPVGTNDRSPNHQINRVSLLIHPPSIFFCGLAS